MLRGLQSKSCPEFLCCAPGFNNLALNTVYDAAIKVEEVKQQSSTGNSQLSLCRIQPCVLREWTIKAQDTALYAQGGHKYRHPATLGKQRIVNVSIVAASLATVFPGSLL